MLYSSQAKKGVAERLERGGFVTDNRYREIPVANEIARLLLWQSDMLPSYRTMKYKSPIWGYFHVQKE